MITAAVLLAGMIIDVSLLHWAMITVTVIAITVAIRYHDVHRHDDEDVVLTLLSSRHCRHDVVTM